MCSVSVFCYGIFTAWLLDICYTVKHTERIGYEGEDFTHHFQYPPGFEENSKYFGRSEGFFNEKLVQSVQQNRWARSGRFSLFDNSTARIIFIIISKLVAEDSGLYFCGVDVQLSADPISEIQITVRKGEPQRPSTSPRVVFNGSGVTTSPENITTNWVKKREQESYVRLVTVLSLVCLCMLFCVCLFGLLKVSKGVTTCNLSVSVSHHTRQVSNQAGDEYEKMSSTVHPHSPTNPDDTNTESATDSCYTDAESALTDPDLDQIYTEMNTNRQSCMYQCLDSVHTSVYQNIK